MLSLDDDQTAALDFTIGLGCEMTDFGEEELVDAANAFARSGFDADEILDLLIPTARFAERTAEPLSETAQNVSTATHAFDLETDRVSRELLEPVVACAVNTRVTPPELFAALERCAPAYVAHSGRPPFALLAEITGRMLTRGWTAADVGVNIRKEILDSYRDD
jgi:hypothetical protein